MEVVLRALPVFENNVTNGLPSSLDIGERTSRVMLYDWDMGHILTARDIIDGAWRIWLSEHRSCKLALACCSFSFFFFFSVRFFLYSSLYFLCNVSFLDGVLSNSIWIQWS